MKPFKLLATVAVALLFLQSIAQKNNKVPDLTPYKRLYIGDTVPMESITFNNVRNYAGGKAKLSDFKGKYIILDFWTKTCTSCIAAFPHMEELQNQFKDDIQILLVTKNSQEELALLSKNSSNVKNTKLPMIIGEHILATKLFPHGTVPYHVWLNKDGKVIATTYAQETNSRTLEDLIRGNQLNLLVKNEVFDKDLQKQFVDSRISLLKVGDGRFQKYLKYYAQIPVTKYGNLYNTPQYSIPNLQYYSMFMSYIPGDMVNDPGLLLDFLNIKNRPIGFRVYNMSIDNLYKNAFIDSGVNVVKIILEDNAGKLYEKVTDSTNLKRYLINNSYCYQSFLPKYNFEAARELLKLDLIRFFGLIGKVEIKPLKHFILTRTLAKNEKLLWSKNQNLPKEAAQYKVKIDDSYVFKGVPYSALLSAFVVSNSGTDAPLVVDETGFMQSIYQQKKIDITLKIGSFKLTDENIPSLRRGLANYGLDLKEEIRSVKVLVLKAVL